MTPDLGFGRELDELRQARGLSWGGLAARSGVSRTYLHDLSTGRRGHRPSEATVEAIAAALEVEPCAFRLYRVRVVVDRAPGAIDQVFERLRAAGRV